MQDELPPLARRFPWVALLLISVFGLFLELLLIRWIGTEIRIFAYLQNTMLVTCFLGLGLGFLFCRRPIDLPAGLAWLAALSLLLAVPWSRALLGSISARLGGIAATLAWMDPGAAFSLTDVVVGLGLTFAVMCAVALAFFPIGQLTGRLLDDRPQTVGAYSVNVAGSLLGAWLFAALSAAWQPPFTWGLVAAALVAPLLLPGPTRGSTIGRAALLVALVAAFAGATWDPREETVWSPYQKLSLTTDRYPDGSLRMYGLWVNNAGYQKMLDLNPATASPMREPRSSLGKTQYDLPYLLHGPTASALLVGAGSGNDASGALRNGVERVTAVEIDPAILAFGRRLHPERPYDDPRVTAVVDDARSFFATTPDRYDVIVFGLLDAHTTTSMTNARLDHYVYTKESLDHAKSLLKPGGLMVLSFSVRLHHVGDRIVHLLTDAFGEPPLVVPFPEDDTGPGGVMFVTGNLEEARRRMAADPALGARVAALQAAEPLSFEGTTSVATDDWPYLYLPKPQLPGLFVLLGALLAGVLFVVRGVRELPSVVTVWSRGHWHFFLLGAAFLLLEVQNISKASVILGNTWQVNAVVISGVLVMALVANLVSSIFPRLPMIPVYALLVCSCVGLYFVDLATFAFWPYPAKVLAVGALTGLPMAFSGVVFVRSLMDADHKDQALGANLIGALVGALLQSITFLTGIRLLLLVVAALYTGAIVLRPSSPASRTPAVPGGGPSSVPEPAVRL